MKTAISFEGTPIFSEAMESLLRHFGHDVVAPEDAELLISNDREKVRAFHGGGCEGILFIIWPTNFWAIEKDLHGVPFGVYQTVEWFHGIPTYMDLFDRLRQLPK